MDFLFARHGESDANLRRIISNRDLPHHLTERGRQQAAELGQRLAGRTIGALYASPITRAQETAQIIGQPLGLSVQTAGALREFDCGIYEGRGDGEAWAAHERAVAAWAAQDEAFCLPEGESLLAMRVRFVPWLADLVRRYAGGAQDVLLISHGSMLHHMLPEVLQNVDRDWPHEQPLRPTALVVARPQADGLMCVEWDGVEMLSFEC
jgi:probable phosphoglycerate mutase